VPSETSAKHLEPSDLARRFSTPSGFHLRALARVQGAYEEEEPTVNRRFFLVALPAFALLNAACPADDDDVTLEEASEAVTEATLASQASILAEGSIELTTSFTLGQAVEEAAEEIRGFVVTQLPCAEVVRDGSTVSISYGAAGDTCSWHGQSFSGTHRVTVTRAAEQDVLVHHEWDGVSNGRVEVNGTADVTWNLDAQTRHVVHELTWTRLSDGRTGTGTGDRLQSPLGGDWSEGIVVDGQREWDGQRGDWKLGINEVEWRWDDAVPQSGSYVTTTPTNKTITMRFVRIDADTINVTIEGPRRDFEFNVNKVGDVQ